MNEVHAAGINGDVGDAERNDGSGRSIETHEMHIDIAVVFEGSGDRQASGERAAETVYKYVDLFALVLGKLLVNSSTVEVIAPNVAFQRDIVSGPWLINFIPRSYRYNSVAEKTPISQKMSNFAI